MVQITENCPLAPLPQRNTPLKTKKVKRVPWSEFRNCPAPTHEHHMPCHAPAFGTIYYSRLPRYPNRALSTYYPYLETLELSRTGSGKPVKDAAQK